MSYKCFIGGKLIETTVGNDYTYAQEDIVYNCLKPINIKGDEKGVSFNKPEDPPKKKAETKVKEIELLTDLDDGSANDGSGGLQKGIVYGKSYTFKVKTYTDGEPRSKSLVKWMYKYHNLLDNKWVEVYSKKTGENYTIHFNEEEMCGRFVYVIAYIEDEKEEGELKVWKHNRFRWFDRKIIEKEIKERTDNKQPWLVNQAGTSLCGMACIFYLFAKEQPTVYKTFAKELFRTGEATFNTYTAKPSIDVLERKMNSRKLVENTGGMPLIDYVTMAGTRNTDNPSYKGGDEQVQAINWPPLMTSLSEKLLGYKEVKSKGIYNPVSPIVYTSSQIENKINDINKQIKEGYKLILMIDADLIDDIWDVSSLDLHWVVLESEIKEIQTLNKRGRVEYQLDFSVYTWGTNPSDVSGYLKAPISKTHFMNNYNGYVKVK